MKVSQRSFLQTPQGGARHSVCAERVESRGGAHGVTRPTGRTMGSGSGTRAFTMVEVAISLAIIGFALVAIIGILPAGLNVQKENREETIINQDLSIWMDAIRSGAEGMDYLTNYVDGIEVISTTYDSSGLPVGNGVTYRYTRFWTDDPQGYPLERGDYLVGLLTTPKYWPTGGGEFLSNNVVAYVRAISGAATEKPPQDNPSVQEGSFAYQLTSEVVPFFSSEADNYDYSEFLLNSSGNEVPAVRARTLANNMQEVHLVFQWPLRPPFDFNAAPPAFPNKVGNGRLAFRTMVGGSMTNGFAGAQYYFIQRGQFEKAGN